MGIHKFSGLPVLGTLLALVLLLFTPSLYAEEFNAVKDFMEEILVATGDNTQSNEGSAEGGACETKCGPGDIKVYHNCYPITTPTTQTNDSCVRKGRGKDCGIKEGGPLEDAITQCCDIKDGKCKCHQDMVNPCGNDPIKNLKCLFGGEARKQGHRGVDDACVKAIACTVLERKNSPDYPNSIPGVIGEGNGSQFAPLHCQCSDGYRNDFFCRCCKGELTEKEQEIIDDMWRNVDFNNLSCPKPGPTHYLETPPNTRCTRVDVPGCTTEKFWSCPPSTPYIEKIASDLGKVADYVSSTQEFDEVLGEIVERYESLPSVP